MPRTISHIGSVRSIDTIAPRQVRLRIDCPTIARSAQPGQFVEVDCTPLPEKGDPYGNRTGTPFLRRPISFCDVDPLGDTFTLVFRLQGAGTHALARVHPGDRLSFLGPLGHGFPIPSAGTCVAVGGGIGVYPLLHLLRTCSERGLGTAAICGYRSPEEAFLLEEFRAAADSVFFASDAGGLDFKGNACEALHAFWSKHPPTGSVTVFTCGPVPMMRSVTEQSAAAGHPCHVSLEQRMGCGTGICLVCACKVRSRGPDGFDYKRCCCEGPVFDAEEVVWE